MAVFEQFSFPTKHTSTLFIPPFFLSSQTLWWLFMLEIISNVSPIYNSNPPKWLDSEWYGKKERGVAQGDPTQSSGQESLANLNLEQIRRFFFRLVAAVFSTRNVLSTRGWFFEISRFSYRSRSPNNNNVLPKILFVTYRAALRQNPLYLNEFIHITPSIKRRFNSSQ